MTENTPTTTTQTPASATTEDATKIPTSFIPDRIYSILKWIAILILPALAVLIGTLGQVWGFDHGPQTAATITALDAFLGAVLGISSIQYHASK